MKKLRDFVKIVGIIILMLLITCCEQPDGVAEFINTNEEEAFVKNNPDPNSMITEIDPE